MDKITRRKFVKGAAVAASAGVLIGTSKTSWAGANERINVAVVGINGRGRSHLGAYRALDNVQVTTICDPDSRLFEPRIKEFFSGRRDSEPKVEQDYRRVLDDKDIDAVSLATPNHWHALGGIWALQADKHAFVEKPLTHNCFEGRQLMAAAKKYGKVIQHGTQLRSNPGFQEGVQLLKDGFIGEVYMARCVCYKWRPSIGKGTPAEPPAELDWDQWQGPAQERPFMVRDNGEGLFVHYHWHWTWDYGNGDIGNQGVHQLDAARWGLGVGLPYRVASMGGMFLWDDDKEVFNVSQTSFMFKGDDGKDKMMMLDVRPWISNDELGGMGFGVIFYGSEGYMSFPNYSGYRAYKGREGEMVQENFDGTDLNHYRNFIDCVRDNNPGGVTAPPIEGHYSSALSHYALTAARVNRVLEIDTETEMVKDDEEANSHLTREYREPYVVPVEV